MKTKAKSALLIAVALQFLAPTTFAAFDCKEVTGNNWPFQSKPSTKAVQDYMTNILKAYPNAAEYSKALSKFAYADFRKTLSPKARTAFDRLVKNLIAPTLWDYTNIAAYYEGKPARDLPEVKTSYSMIMEMMRSVEVRRISDLNSEFYQQRQKDPKYKAADEKYQAARERFVAATKAGVPEAELTKLWKENEKTFNESMTYLNAIAAKVYGPYQEDPHYMPGPVGYSGYTALEVDLGAVMVKNIYPSGKKAASTPKAVEAQRRTNAIYNELMKRQQDSQYSSFAYLVQEMVNDPTRFLNVFAEDTSIYSLNQSVQTDMEKKLSACVVKGNDVYYTYSNFTGLYENLMDPANPSPSVPSGADMESVKDDVLTVLKDVAARK